MQASDVTRSTIPPIDREAREAAASRQAELLKPPGSLGRLEHLAVDLAGMTGGNLGRLWPPAILVFAADHGVAVEGVSAYPSEVTAQMVRSFLQGWAAIAVLAHLNDAELWVIDVGIAGDLDGVLAGVPEDRLVRARVRAGSRNFAVKPALRPAEVAAAIEVGRSQAHAAIASGAGLLVLGEMGIGSTTAAAAIVAAMSGEDVAAVTGAGTGIDEKTVAHKSRVIETALARLEPDPADPLNVLGKVGGLEIAALAGAMVASASAWVPMLLDVFITGAAALIADACAPGCRHYMIASHRSCEPGHDAVLRRLDKTPLLDLRMRLGEASGGALALPLVRAAVRLHLDMATFAEAAVSRET